MAKNGGKIEIVASPYLSDEDIQAIKEGYENRQKIIEGALIRQLPGSAGAPEFSFVYLRLKLLRSVQAYSFHVRHLLHWCDRNYP